MGCLLPNSFVTMGTPRFHPAEFTHVHHIWFLLLCIVWGSNFILMHRSGLAFGPIDVGIWRLLSAGTVVSLLWWWSRHGWIERKHWPHLALAALVGNAIPFVLQPLVIGLEHEHSYFGITISFVPLITIICSVPLLGVWPTWRELVGVTGGLVALAVLLLDGRERGMSVLVLSLAVAVPVLYAISNTYIRRNLRDVPAVPMACAVFMLGALCLLPVYAFPAAMQSYHLAAPAEPTQHEIAVVSLAWLGIVGTGLSGCLFFKLLHLRGPLYAGMVSYLIPLVALGWGLFDGEPVTVRQVVAVIVVLAMVALVQFDVKSGHLRQLKPAAGS